MKNRQKIESLKYPVFVGNTLWDELDSFLNAIKPAGRPFLLMDENTHAHCFPLLSDNLPSLKKTPSFVFAAGETGKNPETLAGLWRWMMREGFAKNDVLLNLGGGVVSDLGGFAAATFKRGVKYINLPTTLISQADAAIGGKTGINVDAVKNQAGAFHDPEAVFIMTAFLSSLPLRHYRGGMAEIIKSAFLNGQDSWDKMRKTVSFWQEDICELLTDSIRFKSGVVALDPYDQGPRQMLNFGHSIGHGLEGLPVCADAKELLHGEAVAVGLICESFLAVESGLMARSVLQEITEVIRIFFELSPLDPEYDEEILQKITQDKKNESDKIIFSLAEKPGKPVLNVSVELHDIQKSFHYYNSLFVK